MKTITVHALAIIFVSAGLIITSTTVSGLSNEISTLQSEVSILEADVRNLKSKNTLSLSNTTLFDKDKKIMKEKG